MPIDEIQREVIVTNQKPSESTVVLNILLVFLAFVLFAVVVYYVSVSLPLTNNMPTSVIRSDIEKQTVVPVPTTNSETTNVQPSAPQAVAPVPSNAAPSESGSNAAPTDSNQ